MTSLYFAYGSNLLLEQMVRRLGPSFAADEPPRIARLFGYRVVFQCPEREAVAYANIVRPGLEVWGVVYRCSDADLIRLDGFEQGYRRSILEVTDESGEALLAAAYRMTHTHSGRLGRPDEAYFRRILIGARRHGLPAHYIADLAAAAER